MTAGAVLAGFSASGKMEIIIDHTTSAIFLVQQKPNLDTPIRSMSLSDIQFSMLSYINTVRVKRGLKKLRLLDNPVAQDHSLYLFTSGNDKTLEYIDHYGPDGSAVRERVKAYNIPLYDGFKAPSA